MEMKTLAPVIALTSGAALVQLRVVFASRQAIVGIECLRRGEAGESLVDRPVELRLSAVQAFATCGLESDLPSPPLRTLEDSFAITFDRVDVTVQLEQASAAGGSGANRAWHLGTPTDYAKASHRVSILAQAALPVRFYFAFEEISIHSGGADLAIEAWTRQHAAWWNGWDEHWQQRPPGSRA